MCDQICLTLEPLCAKAALELGFLMTPLVQFDCVLITKPLSTELASIFWIFRVFHFLVFREKIICPQCQRTYITLEARALMLSLNWEKEVCYFLHWLGVSKIMQKYANMQDMA